MDKAASWVKANRTTVLVSAGAAAVVVVVILGWLTFAGDTDSDRSTSRSAGTNSPTPQAAPGEGEDDDVLDPGPEELPEADLSEEVASWQVKKLPEIPATTDPVEFGEQFARVWMAPNYSAYSKEAFADWVFEHFSPNDVSARLTNDAQVSIHDQMLPATQWQALTGDQQSQAVRLVSVEEPAWVSVEGRAQSFLAESATSGWPKTTLVEAYGIVYTTGLVDGQTRFDYADLHRSLYAIKCDPICGVADVISNDIHRLGGDRHTKTLDDFDLGEEDL